MGIITLPSSILSPAPNGSEMYRMGRVNALFPNLWDGLAFAFMSPLTPTGGQVFDISGHGNNGILTGMTPATDWVPGQHGYALDFDGVDGHVAIDEPIVTEYPFSIFIFAKPLDNTTVSCRVSINNSGEPDEQIFLGFAGTTAGDPVRFSIRDGGSFTDALTTNGYQANVWHTMVGVAHSTEKRFVYLDGGGEGKSTTQVGTHGYDNLWIGGLGDSSPAYSTGVIGIVLIYNRVLSLSEIQHLDQDPFALVRRKGQVIALGGEAPAEGHAGPLVNGPILKSKVGGGLIAA